MNKFRFIGISVMTTAFLFSACTAVLPTPASALGTAELSPAEQRETFLDKMDIKDKEVLGFYHTTMEGSSDARKHNIKKALKKINQEKIKPQAVFSFNEEVGNSNIEEDGWEKAGTILNGQLVDDFGGGICQVSSTLYNATAEAGMTIVERHNHSKSVGYVPAGQDATVAYGVLDFQFQNPYDFPVKIKAKAYNENDVVIAIVRAS
ncbi:MULTISPECIES: VanW family protein [Brevibacillus]|uniref:VanW family protein n=1 Tax=Brevibacillus TaxID=55080 RepID=UPI0004787406|nr:VanW family protein [Brevibacillus sp. NSP2.1]QHZ56789.1 VanW family protein [Brevibacillus sp. NSP2.1]